MSPLVWDLAHIGNYEELWLLREIDGRPPSTPTSTTSTTRSSTRAGNGRRCPILGPDEARAYDAKVRDDVLDAARHGSTVGDRPDRPAARRDGFVYGMVIQHEHQHDETMLATHQLRGDAPSPPGPAPSPTPGRRRPTSSRTRSLVDGGPVRDGHRRRSVGVRQRAAAPTRSTSRRSSSTPRR